MSHRPDDDQAEPIDYDDVELDTHDVHECSVLYPDAPRPDGFCAPRIEAGFKPESVQPGS